MNLTDSASITALQILPSASEA